MHRIASALFALATTPWALASQATASTTPSRNWTTSFAIPGLLTSTGQTSGTFGLGRRVHARLTVGLQASLARSRGTSNPDDPTVQLEIEGDTLRMRLGPQVRWYVSGQRTVRPFLETGVSRVRDRAHTTFNGDTTSSRDGTGGEWTAAVGAEWFPAAWVGISGHTGIRAERMRVRFEGGGGFFSPPTSIRRTNTVATFTSLLTLHLYF